MAPASCVRGHKGGPATGRIGAGRAWLLHAWSSSPASDEDVTAPSWEGQRRGRLRAGSSGAIGKRLRAAPSASAGPSSRGGNSEASCWVAAASLCVTLDGHRCLPRIAASSRTARAQLGVRRVTSTSGSPGGSSGVALAVTAMLLAQGRSDTFTIIVKL